MIRTEKIKRLLCGSPEEAEKFLTDQMKAQSAGPDGMTIDECTAAIAPIVMGLLARVWHLEQLLAAKGD